MANDLLLQVCFKPYGCSTSFIYRPNHHHKGEAAHTDQVCPTVRSVQVLDLVYNYFRPCPVLKQSCPPPLKLTTLTNMTPTAASYSLAPFFVCVNGFTSRQRETLWEQHRVLYIPPNIPVWNSGYCVWRMEQYFPVGWTNPSQVRWGRRCNFLSVEQALTCVGI